MREPVELWKRLAVPICVSFVITREERNPTKISHLVVFVLFYFSKTKRSRFLCVLCVCALDLTCPFYCPQCGREQT